MDTSPPVIDSSSVGDETRFPDFAGLTEAFESLAAAPLDRGRLVHLVRRGEGGRREVLEQARLTPEDGLPGDAWGRRLPLAPESQITVMQIDVATLVANGQPLGLFGDNLFVDLDLSNENLPIGSRVRIGSALLVVTPKPHNGCSKFRARFGHEALRFVSRPETRHRNLRGIHVRVLEPGEIRLDDLVEIVSRGG